MGSFRHYALTLIVSLLLSVSTQSMANTFKTKCGTARIPDGPKTICLGVCGSGMASISCTGNPQTLSDHGTKAAVSAHIWIRIAGSDATVSDLAKQLELVTGWNVETAPAIRDSILRRKRMNATVLDLPRKAFKSAEGRKLRILAEPDLQTFEIRDEK